MIFELKTRLKNTDTGSRLSYQRGGSIPSVLPVASRTYEGIFRSIIPVEYFLVMERGASVTMCFDGIVYREWLLLLRSFGIKEGLFQLLMIARMKELNFAAKCFSIQKVKIAKKERKKAKIVKPLLWPHFFLFFPYFLNKNICILFYVRTTS